LLLVRDLHQLFGAGRQEEDARPAARTVRAARLRSRKNKSNDYGFDPHEQATATYTGMGADINVHDQWAVESMGAIQDRTREHLGQSDKAIVQYRRCCGRRSRRSPAAKSRSCSSTPRMRAASRARHHGRHRPDRGWETFWMEVDVKRRRGAPWARRCRSEIADKVRHLSAAE
jgi:hypothetical protein